MKERATPLGSVEMVAGPEEVREAIASLTEAESVKLQRLAEGAAYRLRRRIWGKDANDILHEAIRRVLENKRHWKPKKVDSLGFLLASFQASSLTGVSGASEGRHRSLKPICQPRTLTATRYRMPFSGPSMVGLTQRNNSSRAKNSPRKSFSSKWKSSSARIHLHL
jgi:hypothetical protein